MNEVWHCVTVAHIMRIGLILLAGLVLSVSACLPSSSSQLTVAAAASFTLVLDELVPTYTQLHGDEPTISTGSTGQLAQQLLNGAPFDVFLAADAVHIEELIDAGLLVAESRTLIAYGRLVVIAEENQQIADGTLAELIMNTQGRIAIANPDHAPYGLAAFQALENSGLWSMVENRIIYAETVRQAAQMVESGNAELGIVAASVVTDRVTILHSIPQSDFHPIEHIAGIRADSHRRREAEAFIAFLVSPSAQLILQANGFTPIATRSD